MVLNTEHFIRVMAECLFMGAYHVTDNLFVAYSPLISSKILILLKTSGLSERTSDSKFLY